MEAIPPKSTTATKAAKILVFIAVFIWAAIAVYSWATPDKPVSEAKQTSTSVGIGQNGIIRTGMPGGVTKEAFDELMKVTRAKDEIGFNQLLASGNVIMVDNNTKVKVIEMALFKKRVRLLDGDHQGAAVWIDSEFVESE